jgi:hypothetical protein
MAPKSSGRNIEQKRENCQINNENPMNVVPGLIVKSFLMTFSNFLTGEGYTSIHPIFTHARKYAFTQQPHYMYIEHINTTR